MHLRIFVGGCADTPWCCALAGVLSPPLGGLPLVVFGVAGVALQLLGFLGIKLLEALLGVWWDFNVCRCFLEFMAVVQLTFDLRCA